MTYPDTNGNGVPDAFERRRPISDILNDDDSVESAAGSGIVIIAIENKPRPPRAGETFVHAGGVERASFDYDSFSALIVKEIISGSIEIKKA